MFRSLTLLAAALVSLWAASLYADDAVLGQMYGSGVHAYFSRDYVRAYEYLTSAIDGGSTDPRCYYFRGLTYIKLGREPEAGMDFVKGAELESRDVDAVYDVARSLGRIQGGTRLLIERYRVKARLAALKHAEEVHKARYEATRTEEKRVLHPPIETAPGLPGEASVKPGVQPVPKPVPEKPIPEDVFEPNPVQQPQPGKTDKQPPKPPVKSPPTGEKPVTEAAPGPTDGQPTESPFETPPTGKKPVTEPAPGPTGGQPPESPLEAPPTGKKPVTEPAPGPTGGPTGGPTKSGNIFSALGKALGKAVAGDRQLPPLPIGPGMQPAEGSDDPFKQEPNAGPPPKTPPATLPGPPPKVPPATAPKAPPEAAPKAPPVAPPKVSPETPDDPFADQPPSKPSTEPVAEPPAKPSGGPSAKPGEEPAAKSGGESAGGPPAEPSPEPPGNNPFTG